jgi:hypothetical protein
VCVSVTWDIINTYSRYFIVKFKSFGKFAKSALRYLTQHSMSPKMVLGVQYRSDGIVSEKAVNFKLVVKNSAFFILTQKPFTTRLTDSSETQLFTQYTTQMTTSLYFMSRTLAKISKPIVLCQGAQNSDQTKVVKMKPKQV